MDRLRNLTVTITREETLDITTRVMGIIDEFLEEVVEIVEITVGEEEEETRERGLIRTTTIIIKKEENVPRNSRKMDGMNQLEEKFQDLLLRLLRLRPLRPQNRRKMLQSTNSRCLVSTQIQIK